MKKAKSAHTSRRYTEFIAERDKALESILRFYVAQQSDLLTHFIGHVKDLVCGLHALGKLTQHFAMDKSHEHKLDFLCTAASNDAVDLLLRLRVSTYTLAHVGEAEAIGRARGKETKYKVSSNTLKDVLEDASTAGGEIRARVTMYFNRLKRDVINVIELSRVLEDDITGTLTRLDRALPSFRVLKRPPRKIKPIKLKEADRPPDEDDLPEWLRQARGELEAQMRDRSMADETLSEEPEASMSTGILDDAAWQQVVEDYKSEELPPNVFRRTAVDYTEEDGVRYYDWEVENEVMEDFVSQVREGQVDAANENGVTDFLWLAVVDKVTDACCLWRDGLTSTQIEEKLKDKDDECDATVPPAHINCRCKLSPMFKDMPEVEPSNRGDFEEWLTNPRET